MVNEPEVHYPLSKKIIFLKSFDEAEDYQLQQMENMTPEEDDEK